MQQLRPGAIRHVTALEQLVRLLHPGFIQTSSTQGRSLVQADPAIHSVLEDVVRQLRQGQAIGRRTRLQRQTQLLNSSRVSDA